MGEPFYPRSGPFLTSIFYIQDLSHVLVLAHQRCRDDKGLVRKSALGLLEALLLLKGRLAAPSNTPPGPEDVLAVEAAAADPLVRPWQRAVFRGVNF